MLTPTRPRRKREILTNSRLRTARSCKREHHLRYDCGLRPAHEDENLRFGSLIHWGLEAWWRALMDGGSGAPLPDALAAVQRETNAIVLEKATVLLECYDMRWRSAPYKPLAVEVEFYTPLVKPGTGHVSKDWILGGKIDVVLERLTDGAVVVADHKTSREDLTPGAPFWQRLRMDPQISTYMRGARSLGYDPVEFVYDVIRKPEIRPLKATPVEARKYTKVTPKNPTPRLHAGQRDHDETPGEYALRLMETMGIYDAAGAPVDVSAALGRWFVRDSLVRIGAELEEHEEDVWDDALMLRHAEIAARFPRNPSACERFGHRMCDYFPLCSGAAQADDARLYQIVQQPHTELEHVPEDKSDGDPQEF